MFTRADGMPKWKILAILLILCGVLFQVGSTARSSFGQIRQAWKAIGKPAVWRGVNFSVNQNFANYIEFLNKTIPADAEVILPPVGVVPVQMGQTLYMQFFLAPRQVANCAQEVEECVGDLSTTGTYILVTQKDRFPPPELLSDSNRLVMFDDDLGVYVPASYAAVLADPTSAPIQDYKSFAQIGRALLLPIFWLIVLTCAGWLMVNRLNPRLELGTQFALGYGLGIGAFSLLLYLSLFIGSQLSRGLILGLTLFSLAIGLGVFLPGWKLRNPTQKFRIPSGDIIYLIIFVIATGFVVALALGQAYHWSDEVVLWGDKGYGIAASGLSSGVSTWGTQTTKYPLNVPLMISGFRVLFGDGLPESKLIFPLYYLGLSILIFNFLRKLIGNHLAGLLTLAFISVPLIFYQGSLAYANLPLTFYLTGAVIAIVGAYETEGQAFHFGMLLGGLFLALAAWTRPEGLILSSLIAILAAVIIFLRDRQSRTLVGLLVLVGPLVLYASVWWITSRMVYQRSVWSGQVFQAGINNILSGNFILDNGNYLMQSFFSGIVDQRIWGFLGIGLLVFIVIIPLSFIVKRPRNMSQAGLHHGPFLLPLGSGLLCIISILGMYLILANDPTGNLSWWIDTGLARMLIPGITLLFLGLVAWAREAYA